MKHIFLCLFLVSCASVPEDPSRLPEPTGTVTVQQWKDYCAREGIPNKDPACK